MFSSGGHTGGIQTGVESSYPSFHNKALLNSNVVMDKNPSCSVSNNDKFPGIIANEEEQNYECMGYNDDTIKMDTNPSYEVHMAENRTPAFNTTVIKSDMQDHQTSDSSNDHYEYDYVHHETAQRHHKIVTTDQDYGTKTSPSLLIKPAEVEYGVVNQPRT